MHSGYCLCSGFRSSRLTFGKLSCFPGKKTLLQNKHKAMSPNALSHPKRGSFLDAFSEKTTRTESRLRTRLFILLLSCQKVLFYTTWRNFLTFLALENFRKHEGCGIMLKHTSVECSIFLELMAESREWNSRAKGKTRKMFTC